MFGVGGEVLTTAGRGRFVVDGNDVVIQIGNDSIPGKRTSADIITFHPQNRPEVVYYRLGSVAAQSSSAQGRRPTPIEHPKPDPTMPINRYTLLSSVPQALDAIAVAFTDPPVSDDEKFARLGGAGAKEQDAFKRKDLMAAAMPGINALLDETRRQRYYAVPFDSTVSNLDSTAPHPGVLAPPMRFAYDVHYDPARKGFDGLCVGGILDKLGDPFGPLAHMSIGETYQPCFTPVPDESLARKVEAARARIAATHEEFAISGTVYVFVTGASGGCCSKATVVRAHMAFLENGKPSVEFDAAY